ncbi:hypothetical protein IscW_ISCW005045, partial [Ixodes scapularis]
KNLSRINIKKKRKLETKAYAKTKKERNGKRLMFQTHKKEKKKKKKRAARRLYIYNRIETKKSRNENKR